MIDRIVHHAEVLCGRSPEFAFRNHRKSRSAIIEVRVQRSQAAVVS
jgi:hypothetical protein